MVTLCFFGVLRDSFLTRNKKITINKKIATMEDLVKTVKINDSRVNYYTTHIVVEIGITDTSILDTIIISYTEGIGAHPIDLIDLAWTKHYDKYKKFIEEMHRQCLPDTPKEIYIDIDNLI